jgi:hypothetical protein
MVSFQFKCDTSKLYVRTYVRESVRCEGRGGVRVGECECHTPKGTWSVRHMSERGEGSTFQFKK